VSSLARRPWRARWSRL